MFLFEAENLFLPLVECALGDRFSSAPQLLVEALYTSAFVFESLFQLVESLLIAGANRVLSVGELLLNLQKRGATLLQQRLHLIEVSLQTRLLQKKVKHCNKK